MNGETFVKICGITNEADALTAIGLGADAIGLVFAPSPRQISISTAKDIVRRLPHDAWSVGVFRDESPLRVVDIANEVGFKVVQLHGHETPEAVSFIAQRVNMVIKAISINTITEAQINAFEADLLLVDGPNPGSGEMYDWSQAVNYIDPNRMILSGGLSSDNVGALVSTLRPFGVDVSTGVEMAPGIKDPRKVMAFVNAVREAESLRPQRGHELNQDSDPDDEPYDWSRP
jgi:phosphoribosylanthranilate isomerase